MNFAQALELIKAIFSLLPMIIGMMKAVQDALGDAPGAQKLAMVRAGLQSIWELEGNVAATFDQAWPQIEKIIAQAKASAVFDYTRTTPQLAPEVVPSPQ